MKVYHGSKIIVKEPLVGVGRQNLDFGQGFYVTDLKEQAVSWVSRPMNADKRHILKQTIVDNYLHFLEAEIIKP